MRRVLVPLDGTPLAASILPDARRLAGQEGQLILVRDAAASSSGYPVGTTMGPADLEQATEYLEDVAGILEQQGVRVETHTLAIVDPAQAIDAAARIYRADLIVCATHGRGPVGRLVRGSVAWRALVNSSVPVLLRHVDEHPRHASIFAPQHTVMVPLDGSELAEIALPLASELAHECNAPLVLLRVVPTLPPIVSPVSTVPQPVAASHEENVHEARSYLAGVAKTLRGPVITRVFTGGVIEQIVRCAGQEQVTDIVLASHGRSGLSRVLLGSVADELIQRLHCPIIVLPALVPQTQREQSELAAPALARVL